MFTSTFDEYVYVLAEHDVVIIDLDQYSNRDITENLLDGFSFTFCVTPMAHRTDYNGKDAERLK